MSKTAKSLRRINLVQFHLFEHEQIDVAGHTAFIAGNGTGKSTLLDAIQIAINAGHGRYRSLNAQFSNRTSGRNLRDYCLGVLRETDDQQGIKGRKRDAATTYITLGFSDGASDDLTVGVCLYATHDAPQHELLGGFVLPGVLLAVEDCLERDDRGNPYPKDWNVFKRDADRWCLEQSRCNAYIHARPEEHAKRLLHELGDPRATIDIRKFLQTFQQTLKLRDIETVDDYIRDNILPPETIDVETYQCQIRQFRELQTIIEALQRRVETLGQIQHQYKRAHTEKTRHASLEALAAEYDLAGLDRETGQLEKDQAEYQGRLEEVRQAERRQSEREDELARSLAEVRARIQADGRISDTQHLNERLRYCEDVIQERTESLTGELGKIASALGLMEQLEVVDDTVALSKARATLAAASQQQGDWDAQAIGDAVAAAERWLKAAQPTLDANRDRLDDELRANREELEAQQAGLERMQQGKTPMSGHADRAWRRLREAGFDVQPVSEFLSITDSDWQPAIEAYLNTQLDDLIVGDGQENAAVALIRGLQGDEAVYNVKIVQPRHVKSSSEHTPAADEVASLVASDNPTALGYVRQAMAGVKFAETEDELARETRAMTVDGMVSKGGGTSRRKLPRPGQLKIGDVRDPSAMDAAREAIQSLQARIDTVRKQRAAYERALHLQADYAEANTIDRNLHRPLREIQEKRVEREQIQARLKESITPDAQELLDQQQSLEAELKTVKQEGKDSIDLGGRLEQQIEDTAKKREKAQQRRPGLAKAVVTAQAASYYDAEEAESQRRRIDSEAEDDSHADRARRARYLAQTAENRFFSESRNAREKLTAYLSEQGQQMSTEDNDWSSLAAWVDSEIERLRSTELMERRAEADQALHDAREAFKNDIAHRLNEHFQLLERHIAHLNEILAKCPTFSNGERYRFRYRLRDDYKKIKKALKYISTQQDAYNDTEDDASDDGSVDPEGALQDLEERIADPDADPSKAKELLTDYRTFYTFDLEILEETGRVDAGKPETRLITTLSKRAGTGSGGENRTPFHVIAGASLAQAYRVNEHQSFYGLMLLDEAFDNMDQVNIIAVMNFLSQNQLQVLLAAPPEDQGKMAGFCNTIQHLHRTEFDVHLMPTEIKSAAHQMLASDDPDLNKDLVQQHMTRQGHHAADRPQGA